MRFIIAAVCVVIVWVSGYMLGRNAGPSCPAEDSCTADYHDGKWHIEPSK